MAGSQEHIAKLRDAASSLTQARFDRAVSLDNGRARANELIGRLKTDAAFREAVRANPSTLVRDGLHEDLAYPFMFEADHGAGGGDNCGGSCLMTHDNCTLTNDCICTGNTIPWNE